MRTLWTAGLIVIASAGHAANYRVKWQPVPDATTYVLYDADTGQMAASLPNCDACDLPAPSPCCQMTVSDGTLARAFATAVNGVGESAPSGVVIVGQAGNTTTTMASPSTTRPPTTSSTRQTTSTVAVPSTTSTTQPPSSGLLAAYAFEETGTTLTDSSGNGRTGNLGSALRMMGKFGGAIAVDGTQQATVPTFSPVIPRTVEAWLFPAALGGWRCALGNADSGGLWYLCAFNNQAAAGYSRTGTGGWVEAFGSTLPLNAWSHVAMTFSATGGVTLFVNGATAMATSSTNGGPVDSAASVKLGRAFTSERWSGRIDEVRFYSRVLTAAEILTDRDRPILSGPTTTLPSGTSSTTSTSSTSSSSRSTSSSSTLTSTSTTTTKTCVCPCP